MSERTIEDYETAIGELSVQAVEKGGEQLLDRVTQALGVATRHLERIRTGSLTLTPSVRREIDGSFARAAEVMTGWTYREV